MRPVDARVPQPARRQGRDPAGAAARHLAPRDQRGMVGSASCHDACVKSHNQARVRENDRFACQLRRAAGARRRGDREAERWDTAVSRRDGSDLDRGTEPTERHRRARAGRACITSGHADGPARSARHRKADLSDRSSNRSRVHDRAARARMRSRWSRAANCFGCVGGCRAAGLPANRLGSDVCLQARSASGRGL